MTTDFTGLKVIWPPDGTKPLSHEHEYVPIQDPQVSLSGEID